MGCNSCLKETKSYLWKLCIGDYNWTRIETRRWLTIKESSTWREIGIQRKARHKVPGQEILLFLSLVLGMEPRASFMLGKYANPVFPFSFTNKISVHKPDQCLLFCKHHFFELEDRVIRTSCVLPPWRDESCFSVFFSPHPGVGWVRLSCFPFAVGALLD